MPKEFKLPELGENIESADIINVLVKAGDKIEKEQSIIEIETDKATIEVPSSLDGIVKEVLVKEGDKIKVGQVLIKVDDVDEKESLKETTSETKEETKPESKNKIERKSKPEKTEKPMLKKTT
jgi:pyruvate dehydrogenase E2 component (dihydrolipoamide acetyltransferase)